MNTQFEQFKLGLQRTFAQIYATYLQSLTDHIANREAGITPIDTFHQNIISFSEDHKAEMAQKLFYIYDYDFDNECSNIFNLSVQQYIERIDGMLDKLQGKNLLASVVDSYENIKYSSIEVATIAHPMFPQGKSNQIHTCMSVIYVMYRNNVFDASRVKEAFSQLNLKRSDELTLHKKIQSIDTETTEFIRNSCQASFKIDNIQTQGELHGLLNRLSIDEIVQFIDGPQDSPKKKKRSKKTKPATPPGQSPSPPNETSELHQSEEDLNVEAFRQKLAEACPVQHRLKPNLSSEWVDSLKSRISIRP